MAKQAPERYKAVTRALLHALRRQRTRWVMHRYPGKAFAWRNGARRRRAMALEQASHTANDELGKNHLFEAVRSLTYQHGCVGLSLKKVEAWSEEDLKRQHWLEPMLAWEIPEWRLEQAARSKDHKLKHSEQKRQRNIDLSKHLAAIQSASATTGILYELAGVWMNHYSNTRGETPVERFDSYCENGRGS